VPLLLAWPTPKHLGVDVFLSTFWSDGSSLSNAFISRHYYTRSIHATYERRSHSRSHVPYAFRFFPFPVAKKKCDEIDSSFGLSRRLHAGFGSGRTMTVSQSMFEGLCRFVPKYWKTWLVLAGEMKVLLTIWYLAARFRVCRRWNPIRDDEGQVNASSFASAERHNGHFHPI